MSVDSGMGNYAGDADLQAIEDETLPGTSNVKKIIGSLRQRLAQDNPVNTDTNINRTERVDVSTPPKAQTPLESLGLGEGFSTPVDYTLPTRLNSVKKSHDDIHPELITDDEAVEHIISHHPELLDDLARGYGRSKEEVIDALRTGDLKPAGGLQGIHKSHLHGGFFGSPDHSHEELVVNIPDTLPDTFNPTASSSVSRFATETSTGTAPMMPVIPQDPSAASITAPGGVPMDNPASGVVLSSFNSIAYVIENGEVKCASCENYYIPESEAHIKSAHCGAPECPDLRTEEDMKGVDGVMVASKLPEDAEEGDVVRGKMIKTTDEETRLASTDDYLAAFEKTASDSQLYYRGYEDAKSGKPLDEDLAELSDDYFHGYDQFRFYHIPAQSSSPQSLYDIKPNSNNNPRMTQGEADLGLNELTDGHSFATHASKSSDNLKEAGPLDFAHSLQQTEQYKRQQRNNLLMNMGFMQPVQEQAESVKRQTDAVCQICKTLGHTGYHAMHESIMPQTTPKFNSGETAPQGPEVNTTRPVHQQIKEVLDVGKNIGTEVAKAQAEMAPRELATEIAGGGPEDPLADIAAGGEEAWAIGKGVAKGLIKSPLKTVQVGRDIKQDVQAVVPKVKKLRNASSIFPVDVIQNFFED